MSEIDLRAAHVAMFAYGSFTRSGIGEVAGLYAKISERDRMLLDLKGGDAERAICWFRNVPLTELGETAEQDGRAVKSKRFAAMSLTWL